MIQEFVSKKSDFGAAISDINKQLGLARGKMRNADKRVRNVKAYFVKASKSKGILYAKYDLQKETRYDPA